MFVARVLTPTLMMLCALFATTARAEITFNFGQGGVIGGTTFNAMAGSTITLEIYLTQQLRYEPVPGFMFSDLRMSNNGPGTGIGSYLVDLSIVDADTPMAIQTDVLPQDPAPPTNGFIFGPGFLNDTTSRLDPNNNGSINVLRASTFATNDPTFTSPLTPVYASNTAMSAFNADTPGSIAINSILAGTATINVSAFASGDYLLSLSAMDMSALPTLLGNSIVNGPFITPSSQMATLTISAVPEPCTWPVLGIGTIIYGRRRMRRRKSSSAAAAA